jgi:hypothetical protein
MEKIKQFKIIIILVLVVIGTSFYWFQLRPAQIRKSCWDKIEKIKSGELKSEKYVSQEFQIALGNQKATEDYYGNCLKGKGLDK